MQNTVLAVRFHGTIQTIEIGANLMKLFTLCAALLSCLASYSLAAQGVADSIYFNGRIYTASGQPAWIEAVAIADGRFIYTGSSDKALELAGEGTSVVDLDGKMAMPGIHDAHSHMIWGGLNRLYECRLPPGATPAQIIVKLKDCGRDVQEGEWLVGGSAWSEQFPEKRFHRRYIDKAFPDRPVYIGEGSAHHAFINTRAMEIAGIDASTPNPPGGRIVKDESGEPTGELVENATLLVADFLKREPREHFLEALRWGTKLFSQYGITSTQEASGEQLILETLRQVDREGGLQQKFAAHIIWGSPKFAHADDAVMEKLINSRHDYASKHVEVDFVKMWVDGSPTPPYFTEASINFESKQVDPGNLLIPFERMRDFVVRLDSEGIKMKLHVAGAGAAHTALDAFEAARNANPDSPVIHELGHSNMLIPEDFKRMQQLRIAADMSPSIWHLYGPTLGNPPVPAWQFRTMKENGVLMTIGTDWPVTDDPNVFPAIQGMLDRGYESVDLDTALKMLTINGAVAQGWQKDLGSIEKGKVANMIVLDRRLFDIHLQEIGKTRVLLTVFEGEVVHNVMQK